MSRLVFDSRLGNFSANAVRPRTDEAPARSRLCGPEMPHKLEGLRTEVHVESMPAASPLQILLFRHTEDPDVLPYEEAIIRAFQGGKETGGYLATGEDLGIQSQIFSEAPPPDCPVAKTLDSFCHTLT